MLCNFFKTYLISFFFFSPVLSFSFIILRCCRSYNRLKRLYNLIILNFSCRKNNRAIFNTSCSLYNNMFSNLDMIFARCKEIYLSCLSESYTYNLNHLLSPFLFTLIPATLHRLFNCHNKQLYNKIKINICFKSYLYFIYRIKNILQTLIRTSLSLIFYK